MTAIENDKTVVTDDLSGDFQGPALCPVCGEGYALVVKGTNEVNSGVVLDCYYEQCVNGCASEFASAKCIDENARIAREAGITRESVSAQLGQNP